MTSPSPRRGSSRWWSTVVLRRPGRSMNLLLLTNVYPSPVEPGKGVFNRHLARALAREHRVDVVAPVSWVEELRARSRGPNPPALSLAGANPTVSVHHPRFYYPPKVLRGWYARFYWWSVRRTVLGVLRERRPDAVIGYWAHPDGAVAVRVARRTGARAVVMV